MKHIIIRNLHIEQKFLKLKFKFQLDNQKLSDEEVIEYLLKNIEVDLNDR